MRCLSCQVALSNFESTRKYTDSGKYVDLCNECFGTISREVSVTERADLRSTFEEAYEDDYRINDWEVD